MPCDNRSTIVNVEYSDCIDYVEQITNQLDCNYFICAGDYNTCFSRSNAQTNCLDDFIERNNILVNWNYANVSVKNTYCNFALNHFSCIDHFIMSKNVLDSISKHNVISDVQNPSSHNILSLSFEFKVNHYVPLRDDKSCNINKCKWAKASSEDLNNYRHISEDKLADIVVPKSVNCINCHCSLDNHTNEINLLCNAIIDGCVSAGKNCIPLTGHNLKKEICTRLGRTGSTSKRTIITLALDLARGRKAKQWSYLSYHEAYSSPIPLRYTPL